jgi:DnaJ-class molecular chaperone
MFPTTKSPLHSQESRRKCIICGGTGRYVQLNLGMRNRSQPQQSRSCSSCNGTGRVDNPLYRR